MHSVWDTLATKNSNGYDGYARSQASIYLELHDNAKKLFAEKGEPRLLKMKESTIVQVVRKFREEELGWLSSYAQGRGSESD